MRARTYFYHLDGRVDKIPVDVIGYDEKMKKFDVELILPSGEKATKPAGRLNLVFDGIDTDEGLQRRFQNA